MKKQVSRRIPVALRIKRILPKSLYGRTLLIFIAPAFIILVLAAYMFFARHWLIVTKGMTDSLAGDVAFITSLIEQDYSFKTWNLVANISEKKMGISVSLQYNEILRGSNTGGPVGAMLKRSLREKLTHNFSSDVKNERDSVIIKVQIPQGVLVFSAPGKRVYSPTTHVFIMFWAGTSVLMTLIALLFMRNQIKPIRELAIFAEEIGKGSYNASMRIRGATEVRKAITAVMLMKDRLGRQISQRTTMLAGVSHDLRTPLTRMRLQLEMMPKSEETTGLLEELSEMEQMLNAYLAFAKGEESESLETLDLKEFLEEIVSSFKNTELISESGIEITVRKKAMKRCISNLIGNALRYGTKAQISTKQDYKSVSIIIDDDGTGIPESMREEIFKPFVRLDESRNSETGGVGLGLSIARDIARSHGGDIVLSNSPLGGLKAIVQIPI